MHRTTSVNKHIHHQLCFLCFVFIFNKTIIVCIRFETARIQHYDYIYILFLRFYVHVNVLLLCEARCAHRCRWDMTLQKWLLLLLLFLLVSLKAGQELAESARSDSGQSITRWKCMNSYLDLQQFSMGRGEFGKQLAHTGTLKWQTIGMSVSGGLSVWRDRRWMIEAAPAFTAGLIVIRWMHADGSVEIEICQHKHIICTDVILSVRRWRRFSWYVHVIRGAVRQEALIK